MIINTKEVESLIKSTVPALWISEETGVNVKGITNYRTGRAKLNNMTRGYLEALQQFYNDHENSVEGKKMENIKIKGIRRAVGEFNKWQGAARVYFDPSTMSVWTNVYGGTGEEDCYDNPAITQIAQKATNLMDERDDRITMRQIREAVAEMIIAGSKKGH